MCSDTGTEYGMGGRPWTPGLSDSSAHGVTTGVAGSSLTGMGVASGAGMHCALERSAEARGGGTERQRQREGGMGGRETASERGGGKRGLKITARKK